MCLSLNQENVAFIQVPIYLAHNQLLKAMNKWRQLKLWTFAGEEIPCKPPKKREKLTEAQRLQTKTQLKTSEPLRFHSVFIIYVLFTKHCERLLLFFSERKVGNFSEQSNQRISLVIGAYWNHGDTEHSLEYTQGEHDDLVECVANCENKQSTCWDELTHLNIYSHLVIEEI